MGGGSGVVSGAGVEGLIRSNLAVQCSAQYQWGLGGGSEGLGWGWGEGLGVGVRDGVYTHPLLKCHKPEDDLSCYVFSPKQPTRPDGRLHGYSYTK